MPVSPFIVNILPAPDSSLVRVSEPVRFSVRDIESFIDPTSLNVDVAYAKIFSHATESFERLPRTLLASTFGEPIDSQATIDVTPEGVRIIKTASPPQRSTFFTSVDAGSVGTPSAMVSALIRPEVEDVVGATGAGPLNQYLITKLLPPPLSITASGTGSVGCVLGLEHGPRNTGAYAYFLNIGTVSFPVYAVRLVGPNTNGIFAPDLTFLYDWTDFHRYFLVWNEVIGKVEFFGDVGGVTVRIASVDISEFQFFGTTGIGTPRRGGTRDITAVYGQEGEAGDRVTIKNIAVTTDVDFPFIGGARPGTFIATRKSAEVTPFVNEDPRLRELSPWFDSPLGLFPAEDLLADRKMAGKAFRLTKINAGTTVSVFREEPGFHRADTDGFLFESTFFAEISARDEAGTNMGFTIFDGQSVFQLDLLDDSRTRNVGLLRKGGLVSRASGHFLPTTPLSWSSPVSFRFTVDNRRGVIELFQLPDIRTPIMSIAFDRTKLPSAADMGWVDKIPFIAVGAVIAGPAIGSLDVYSLNYSHLYQAFETRDAALPDATSPLYTKVGTGTAVLVSEGLQLTSAPGQTLYYHRRGILDPFRGSIVEARLKIPSFKPRSRTGTYLVLDDGEIAYMLSFVDSALGKFGCLALTAGLNDIGELVGTEGLGGKVSFPVDWTQFHTYRMERRPDEGLLIFVDQAVKPSLVVRERDHLSLAQTRQNLAYPTPPFFFPPPSPGQPVNGSVAFGQLKEEGSVSVWEYVRHTFSLGFEITCHKNETPAELVAELSGTQALVVAYALDEDA